MHWIAPTEKDADNSALEKCLWDGADQFRTKSGLSAISAPTSRLIHRTHSQLQILRQMGDQLLSHLLSK